jgi:hypothetical protein
MRPDPNENRLRRFAISIATRSVAAFIALSFLAALLPAGMAAAKSIMACCKGQAAGHCHAGFKTKKTISISNPCHSDCCASSAPAQQQRRERITLQSTGKHISPAVASSPSVNVTQFVSASGEWPPVSPRGPPRFFVEQIS